MSNYIAAICAINALVLGISGFARADGAGQTEGEVTFIGSGGLTLHGSLLKPNGKGPFPAFLLLSGSGPTDRDGNQPGMQVDTLKDIANELAGRGIATLRFDKRATQGYASQFPKTLDGLRSFFGWNVFLSDAEGGFAFLKSAPGIDPNHVGVLGHSEGGTIALAMAKDVQPYALVLVSTPSRNFGDLIIDQVENGYSAQFTDPATLKQLGYDTERIVKAIRDTKMVPDDVPTNLKSLFSPYMSDYLYGVFTFEPTSAAQAFAGPALVVQGEKDVQVSPTKDGPVLFAAFPKGKASYYSATGCSHCLKHPTGPKDPGFSGPTDTDALHKIGEWASQAFSH